MSNASFQLYDKPLDSRLLLGSALYPSPRALEDSVKRSGTQIVTLSLRRETARDSGAQEFWDLIKSLNINLLPNTAGCRTAKEAITTALMGRELFGTK